MKFFLLILYSVYGLIYKTIIEDIKLYYHSQDQMQEDDRLNYLLGLATIYQAKFEKTFATFEELCKSGF